MARNWCGSSEEREELNSSRKTEKGLENVDDDGGGRISLDVEYGYFGGRKLECDRTRFKRRKTSCWEVHHGTIVWTQRTVVYSSTPSRIRESSSYPWPRSMTTDRCRGSASTVRRRSLSVSVSQMGSRPITFLYLWPATDHEPHCRHVPINRI